MVKSTGDIEVNICTCAVNVGCQHPDQFVTVAEKGETTPVVAALDV
jgi:hypothetical protein